MIIKFNSNHHKKILKNYDFSFFSEPAYLDCLGYLKFRNNEYILVARDIYDKDYHLLFLPRKKVNYKKSIITFCDKNCLEALEINKTDTHVKVRSENEYFYQTKSIINLKDKKFRKRVLDFKKNNYILKFSYPKYKIIDFYIKWKKQKERNGIVFKDQEKFFYFLLENLDKYSIRQVYVEINNEIVGFAWGVKSIHKKNWVGLKAMSLYGYGGLGRYLQWEIANLFSDFNEFTLGTGCKDEGVTRFKKELKPSMIKEYYYIETI